MVERMKTHAIWLGLCILALVLGTQSGKQSARLAVNPVESVTKALEPVVAPNQKNEPLLVRQELLTGFARIEEAIAGAYNDSIMLGGERAGKQLPMLNRLEELIKKGANSKRPVKDFLTAAESDEFSQLTSQLKYFNVASFGEVLKRRKLAELKSLLEVFKLQDDVFIEIAGQHNSVNAQEINAATDKRAEEKLGESAKEWGAVLSGLNEAQKRKIARTTPLDTLVNRMEESKMGISSPAFDDLEFLREDNLKDEPSFQIFVERLRVERNRGSTDAEKVWAYLSKELAGEFPTR
jgi:hypothetical protein